MLLQIPRLQYAASPESPLQSAPPGPGGGLSQARFLALRPCPHVLEQADQLVQSDHAPSAER